MEAGMHYEFDSGQNALIGLLAKRMKWVAWFMFAFAGIAGIAGVMTLNAGGASAIVQAVLMLIIAVWTRRAAIAFEMIVQTEGSDITNLMGALGELKKLYTLQYWVIIIAIVFVVIALVVGIGAAAAGAT
jgi:hypothetical protein